MRDVVCVRDRSTNSVELLCKIRYNEVPAPHKTKGEANLNNAQAKVGRGGAGESIGLAR